MTSSIVAFKTPALLAEEIAQFMGREIIFCELAPGSRLTEEGMSQRYGVSRSPIREAFRLIEAEGLVQRSARRGIRVTPTSRRDLDEVYSCRILLEGQAAAEAASFAAPAECEALQATIDAMAAALKREDAKEYFLQNVAFTAQIHQASRNRTLIRLLDGISKQAQRYRYVAYLEVPELMRVSLPGNAEILGAIQQRQAERAREITQRLIRNAWESIAPHVEDTETDPAPSAPN